MDSPLRLFFTALLIATSAINGAQAYAMVTGTVFCDQCKDGHVSLFDYPLYGIKVALTCADGNGQLAMSREETTNWFGSYAVRFDGTPDLSGCYAQVMGGGQGCGAVAGPAQTLRLMFTMFSMEMYTVDPLLSEPAQPMSYCPRSAAPVVPAPVITPVVTPPPPVERPPLPPMPPQLPPLPPVSRMPFSEASACPSQNWTMPEYQCYWKVLAPDMKVAVVFGLIAARRYGTDMTLRQGMQGRGDPYRTLLREGTTALLNSYNSRQFSYLPFAVIEDMNLALLGSTGQVLRTALRFLRANSGNQKVSCRFTPCK